MILGKVFGDWIEFVELGVVVFLDVFRLYFRFSLSGVSLGFR